MTEQVWTQQQFKGARVLVVTPGCPGLGGLSAALQALGAKCLHLHAPVEFTDLASIEFAFARARSVLGGIDGLVLAVGAIQSWQARFMVSVSVEQWRSACLDPLRTSRQCLQAAWRVLAGAPASIVWLGPALSLTGAASLVALSVLGEGQRALMKSAARQWGGQGIRLNWLGLEPTLFAPELAAVRLPQSPELGSPPSALASVPAIEDGVAQSIRDVDRFKCRDRSIHPGGRRRVDGAMNPNVQAVMLAGKTALVTGAGGGVGRGIALALAAAGARVVIAVRRGMTGEETAGLIRAEGGEAFAVETDVTVLADVKRVVDAARTHFAGLDILVHNATHGASGHPRQLQDFDDEDWDAQVAVDLGGAHHCAVAAFEWLRASGDGRMILLCSTFGLHGAALNPAYAAVKGGIRGLTKALAREWGPCGISVNAISPSALTAASSAFFASQPGLRERYVANFPLGRMGHVRDDVGRAVAHLCAPGMGYVTGQIIQVDGGLYTAL